MLRHEWLALAYLQRGRFTVQNLFVGTDRTHQTINFGKGIVVAQLGILKKKII